MSSAHWWKVWEVVVLTTVEERVEDRTEEGWDWQTTGVWRPPEKMRGEARIS